MGYCSGARFLQIFVVSRALIEIYGLYSFLPGCVQMLLNHSHKHQTLNKVYFPFCAVYKMNLGTLLDSWALAGSAWNHFHWCAGQAGLGSAGSQVEPLESQVSHWQQPGTDVQLYKDFPPKGVSETRHICLPGDECSLLLAVCIRPSWSASCENTDYNW